MKQIRKIKLACLIGLVSLGILTGSDMTSAQVNSTTVYKPDYVPTKPGNLNATPLYYNLVRLTWTDQSNNETGFRIYTKDKYRDQYRMLFEVSENKTSAYVWELDSHTEYFFYVVAFNQYGNSENSNIAKVITPYGYITGSPEAPSDLQVIEQNQTEVEIGWTDNSNNELGFKIARKLSTDDFFEIIDSVQTDVLTYREVGLEPDRIYIYKVCAYNEFGFSDYTNTVSINTKQSDDYNEFKTPDGDYNLKANYPNPFNPSTKIEFNIPEASNAKLTIYNALGEEVATLSNSFLQAGNYLYEWNAADLSSGVYFYKLEAGDFTEVKRMILIK